MQRNEILNLNLVASTNLWNGYQLFSHELFDVLFIERDNSYEVWEEDQSKLDRIKEFEEKKPLYGKKNICNTQ